MAAPGATSRPFLVLSDSTLQFLLHGKSYGIYPIFDGYVLSCPGAAMALSSSTAPSILELLHWQFGQTMGSHSFKAPVQNEALAEMLRIHTDSARFIPIEQSLLPQRQAPYDFLAEGRVQYGFSAQNLYGHEIMLLENLPNIDKLYSMRDLHFRPQVAEVAIGALVARAIDVMRTERPDDLPILAVANWNARLADLCTEMTASRAVAQCRHMRELAETAAHFSQAPWSMRHFYISGLARAPIPNRIFQTYIHDNTAEPREMCAKQFANMQRQFCDDAFLRQTVQSWAGTYGLQLLDRLKSPAHRADVFRYIYHYKYGGMYLDIKFAFVRPWAEVLTLLAAEWGTAQISAARALGYNPSEAGTLPQEYLVMAIGVKQDHIFQGIIYGKSGHPLMKMAIQHAFGGRVRTAIANLEYMIFCKYLWATLEADMGKQPKVGWNLSTTYGPVYLFQEKHDVWHKKNGSPPNEGHHFVTARDVLVAYTRCWGWRKGFPDDPDTKSRTNSQTLAHMPAAVAEATALKSSGHSPDAVGAQPGDRTGVPSRNQIAEHVEQSLHDNSFATIMEIVPASSYYRGDLSEQDVLELIPRGLAMSNDPSKPDHLGCRFCERKGFFVTFRTGGGIKPQFRQNRHNASNVPVEPENPPSSSYAIQGSLPQHPQLPRLRLPQFEPPVEGTAMVPYVAQDPPPTVKPMSQLTREDVLHELESPALQRWILSIANFQVLGSPTVIGGLTPQEQRPLWQSRIEALAHVPRLFPIDEVRTEKGLTWDLAMTVRPVLTAEGKITVATGHGRDYYEMATPTKVHGLISALFQRMWTHHAELKRQWPELGIRIVHDAATPYRPGAYDFDRQKRAYQNWWYHARAKRHKDEPSSSSRDRRQDTGHDYGHNDDEWPSSERDGSWNWEAHPQPWPWGEEEEEYAEEDYYDSWRGQGSDNWR
ncbi:unnamed protein product [Symbiodinium sp. CCMP2456]|nr:unnamed protein product [Symbiodinium sp. CCMP2456]